MKAASQILDDSIKATLFGKFYERIVLGWLTEKKVFSPFTGKPRVYWRAVEYPEEETDLSQKLKAALEKHRAEKQFCTPDGFLEKAGKYYIWEAKNWPMWTEGKQPLDQLRDLLCSMPLVLATKAVFRTKEYTLNGVLFSWWSRPHGVDTLVQEIARIVRPRSFEVLYTSEVLSDCLANKYPWYLKIIEGERRRVDELFKDLAGQA